MAHPSSPPFSSTLVPNDRIFFFRQRTLNVLETINEDLELGGESICSNLSTGFVPMSSKGSRPRLRFSTPPGGSLRRTECSVLSSTGMESTMITL